MAKNPANALAIPESRVACPWGIGFLFPPRNQTLAYSFKLDIGGTPAWFPPNAAGRHQAVALAALPFPAVLR